MKPWQDDFGSVCHSITLLSRQVYTGRANMLCTDQSRLQIEIEFIQYYTEFKPEILFVHDCIDLLVDIAIGCRPN